MREKKDPDQEINEPKKGVGYRCISKPAQKSRPEVQKFPCKPIGPVINRRKGLFTDRRETTLQKTL
jgi:hypothetical protein